LILFVAIFSIPFQRVSCKKILVLFSNCLFLYNTNEQTNKQTNKQMNKQMNNTHTHTHTYTHQHRYFLVNDSKNRVQNELVAALYKEQLFSELLEEGPQVATRRQACSQLLDVLKRAHTILNEVRDMDVCCLFVCLLFVVFWCCFVDFVSVVVVVSCFLPCCCSFAFSCICFAFVLLLLLLLMCSVHLGQWRDFVLVFAIGLVSILNLQFYCSKYKQKYLAQSFDNLCFVKRDFTFSIKITLDLIATTTNNNNNNNNNNNFQLSESITTVEISSQQQQQQQQQQHPIINHNESLLSFTIQVTLIVIATNNNNNNKSIVSSSWLPYPESKSFLSIAHEIVHPSL
jgi:hypothetical protein